MMLIQQIALLTAALLPQEAVILLPQEDGPAATEVPDRLGSTELRIYEIGHLTGHERLDTLLSEVARGDGMRSDVQDRKRLDAVENLSTQADSTMESLSRAYQDMLEPAFDERRNKLVHLGHGKLAVIANAQQHAWLDRLIADASAFEGMVDIQARIYRLDLGSLARLGQQRSGLVLATDQANELLAQLDYANESKVLAPRVIAHPFQKVELSVVNQLPYIQDFELKTLQGVEIADPVIAIAETGLHLRFRTMPIGDGKLSVDAHIEHSTVAEPIPTFEKTIGAGAHKVSIQVPEITSIKLDGRFEVLPSQTLVMATVDSSGKQEVIVLVTATRLDDPATEE